jgi:hypothetical protein
VAEKTDGDRGVPSTGCLHDAGGCNLALSDVAMMIGGLWRMEPMRATPANSSGRHRCGSRVRGACIPHGMGMYSTSHNPTGISTGQPE